MTVPALLPECARRWPEEHAIVLADGGRLSYEGWYRRANAAALGLRDVHGVRPGDRVLLPCGADWIGYAAVVTVGGVPVPVNESLGEQITAGIFRASRIIENTTSGTWQHVRDELQELATRAEGPRRGRRTVRSS